MGTEAHTPGPWVISEYDRPGELIFGADGSCVAEMGHDGEPRHGREAKDARLTAAAPEMLAALQAYADAYDNATGTIHVNAQVRAALAKASPRSLTPHLGE